MIKIKAKLHVSELELAKVRNKGALTETEKIKLAKESNA